jgi:hypothetical protein
VNNEAVTSGKYLDSLMSKIPTPLIDLIPLTRKEKTVHLIAHNVNDGSISTFTK